MARFRTWQRGRAGTSPSFPSHTNLPEALCRNQSNPIPSDASQLAPILVIRGAAKAIDFYKRIFGATEVYRMETPDGKIGNADLQIGTSHFMLCDGPPEADARSPQEIGGSPVALYLFVEDVDEVAARAQKAGVKFVKPVEDQFWGDRTGRFVDPFGHTWWIASRRENLSPKELKQRADETYAEHSAR
jgi:PhnB protein